MDPILLLEQFGLPVMMVLALGWYVKSQNKWIQEELQTELRESFARQEAIVVKLIEQVKKTQIILDGNRAKMSTIIEVMQALSGNGLIKPKKERY